MLIKLGNYEIMVDEKTKKGYLHVGIKTSKKILFGTYTKKIKFKGKFKNGGYSKYLNTFPQHLKPS